MLDVIISYVRFQRMRMRNGSRAHVSRDFCAVIFHLGVWNCAQSGGAGGKYVRSQLSGSSDQGG